MKFQPKHPSCYRLPKEMGYIITIVYPIVPDKKVHFFLGKTSR